MTVNTVTDELLTSAVERLVHPTVRQSKYHTDVSREMTRNVVEHSIRILFADNNIPTIDEFIESANAGLIMLANGGVAIEPFLEEARLTLRNLLWIQKANELISQYDQTEMSETLEEWNKRFEAIEGEISKKYDEISKHESKQESYKNQIENAQDRIIELERQLFECKDRLAQLEQEKKFTDNKLEDLDKEVDALHKRKTFVQNCRKKAYAKILATEIALKGLNEVMSSKKDQLPLAP